MRGNWRRGPGRVRAMGRVIVVAWGLAGPVLGAGPDPETVAGAEGSSPIAPDLSEPVRANLVLPSRRLAGKLRSLPRPLADSGSARDRIQAVLEALAGPFGDPDLIAPVPAGTRLLAFHRHGDELIVDLSREFLDQPVTGRQEAWLDIASLVHSLLSVEPGSRVRILVEGQERTVFRGHLDLSRSFSPDPGLLAGP